MVIAALEYEKTKLNADNERKVEAKTAEDLFGHWLVFPMYTRFM